MSRHPKTVHANRKDRLTDGQRVYYLGPHGTAKLAGEKEWVEYPVGTVGKVRGTEHSCVYVDWGEDREGWVPRCYIGTYREYLGYRETSDGKRCERS